MSGGEPRQEAAVSRATRKPRVVRTLADVRKAFQTGTIDRRWWTVCIDSGGCFLRYVGPNPDDKQPAEPVDLQLTTDPFELIEELMDMAGIPAERA